MNHGLPFVFGGLHLAPSTGIKADAGFGEEMHQNLADQLGNQHHEQDHGDDRYHWIPSSDQVVVKKWLIKKSGNKMAQLAYLVSKLGQNRATRTGLA